MTVEVIVPWRGGDDHRTRALRWVLERLRIEGLAVRLAEAPEGIWSKGRTLLPAVEASRADVVVIHDADVASHGLGAALEAVEAGEPWAMPHGTVYRLSEAATGELVAGGGLRRECVRDPYTGWWGGGIVAIPRDTYLSVPMDPRFEDWGGEDLSWANALWFLCGQGWRGHADLIHLWHPPQAGAAINRGSQANRDLARRYRQARRDPNEMRALVNEIGGVREPV